jgi:hypothetical protein
MAKNIAARRAAKAQRRKAVVAQKRRMEMETNSTAGQVRVASAVPIQHCLVSEGLFGTGVGMGMLVLARGATPYNVTMATFLLDTFALGVKDVFLRSLDSRDFDAHMDRMSRVTPMVPADPSYARKLLHDLVAWSRALGFSPHPDYAKVEPLFGTTDAGTCGAVFEFGKNGKPLLAGDLPATEWDLEFDIEDGDVTIDGDAADTSESMVLQDASGIAPHAEAD